MSVAPESGRNRIMIYGSKNDGACIVEFKTGRWRGACDFGATERDCGAGREHTLPRRIEADVADALV
jgi:hypothetical protein